MSIALGLLQIFIGIGGVPAGLIFITDPSGSGMGFSLELLEGSPSPNYSLPGVFLFAVNGVTSPVGGVLSLVRQRYAGAVAMAPGALLVGWIVVQVAMVGLVHWLQPLYLGLVWSRWCWVRWCGEGQVVDSGGLNGFAGARGYRMFATARR